MPQFSTSKPIHATPLVATIHVIVINVNILKITF